MNRFLKQLIYGIFYAIALAGIGFGFYKLAFIKTAPPSCFDNIKNQDETEIDCGAIGGKCASCEFKNIKINYADVKAISLGMDTSTIFLEVSNPSENYGLKKFDYTFNIFSRFGPLIQSVQKQSSLYPGEKKYIIESGLGVSIESIGSVEFKLGDLNWENIENLPSKEDIRVSGIKEADGQGARIVSGKVLNNSNRMIRKLILAAAGYDNSGGILRFSTTEIENVLPNKDYAWKIFLPKLSYKEIRVYEDALPE